MPSGSSENGLSVALREYIEQQVEHERDLRVAAFLARDEGLRLQAKEYERRLSDLNDHLKRTTEDRATFYTKESHEAFAVEYRRFRDETRQHETTVRTWGTMAVIVLGALQFAIQLIVHLWKP
jgi:hypothetical protein